MRVYEGAEAVLFWMAIGIMVAEGLLQIEKSCTVLAEYVEEQILRSTAIHCDPLTLSEEV